MRLQCIVSFLIIVLLNCDYNIPAHSLTTLQQTSSRPFVICLARGSIISTFIARIGSSGFRCGYIYIKLGNMRGKVAGKGDQGALGDNGKWNTPGERGGSATAMPPVCSRPSRMEQIVLRSSFDAITN
jgi:hypothetical protein